MRNNLSIRALTIILSLSILSISGCNANTTNSPAESEISPPSESAILENDAPAVNEVTVTFPVDDEEKDEFNVHIYGIEPFDLSFVLPDGWRLEKWTLAGGYDFITVFSTLNIFNEKKECVGVIGYNFYEPYEGAEDDPRAIYSQIALGNNYHFDVRDSYMIVNRTDSGTTAIADVYYAAVINDGVEKYNKGIISYNKDFLVYIAAEFNSSKVTDEQITGIAESIQILRYDNDEPSNKAPQADSAITVIRGMVTPMNDERIYASGMNGNLVAGTSQDYLTISEFVADMMNEVSNIYVTSMGVDCERELTQEEISSIISILQTSPISEYESLGNPPTGGNYFVLAAYDASGNVYLRVSFNGYWVAYQTLNNDMTLVFNGESSGLEAIRDIVTANATDHVTAELSDPNNIIVDHETKQHNSNIPTPDPNAPLGSPENPIAADMTDPDLK